MASYLENLRQYRFLLHQMVQIDITKVYKKSFIGISWMFITPIFQVITWVFLHGAGVFEPGETSIPYPAYVLLSTSIWAFFHDAYKSISTVITSNGRFFIMTDFPHEVLISSRLVVHLINFSVPFAINILVLILYGIPFTWLSLLFPLTLIPLLLLGVGIGLLVSMLRVVGEDFSRIIDQAIGFLMFLTPIIYAPKVQISWLAGIVAYNPLTYLIGFSRDVLVNGTFTNPTIYLVTSAVSIAFFFVATQVFMRSERKLLERLINV